MAQNQNLTTVVATVSGVSPDVLEAEIRATLERLGAVLVPCGWAPDADTIVEETGASAVEVVDLNPGL